MNAFDLLQSLRRYMEEITINLILTTKVEKGSRERTERPPYIFVGKLPDPESKTQNAPYILLKMLTGKDNQEAGGEQESECKLRIIVVTYSKDNENYMQCLNVINLIRQKLLEDRVIDQRYTLQLPLEYIMYEDDTGNYQVGELMTIWELPTVQRTIKF